MKKNIQIISVFFLLASASFYARDCNAGKSGSLDYINGGGDSTEAKIGKNNVSINIVPFVQFLTGAYTGGDVQRFTFMYRRRIKNSCYLRFGMMFDKIKTSYYNANDTAYTLISQTDSSQFRKFDKGSRVYIKPALLIGFEKEGGHKHLKHFYGADLAIGAYKYYNTQYYHTYIPDPLNQNSPWKPSPDPDILIQREDVKAVFVGLMPFYGMRYQFSEHWLLSAQVGLNIFLDAGQMTTENSNNDTFTQPYHKLNTTAPGLVNDVSLILRF